VIKAFKVNICRQEKGRRAAFQALIALTLSRKKDSLNMLLVKPKLQGY